MTIDGTVNQVMNEKPGFFSKALNTVKNTASNAYTAVKYAALATALIIAADVNMSEAAPGNPLDSLPSSSAVVSTINAPSGYGSLTGADSASTISTTDRRPGDMWAATTDKGYLLEFNKDNATPVNVVDMGLPGATGVAYLGNDTFAVSVGKTLAIGSVSGSNWNLANIYNVNGVSSDMKDVSFVNGKYVISADGVRMATLNGNHFDAGVDMGLPSGWEALKLIDFKDNNTYSNRMLQYAQGSDFFKNMDSSDTLFGNPKDVFLDNDVDITGIAYYNGGFAVVQSIETQIHSPLDFQNEMVVGNVPEPATIGLLGLGGLAMLLKRRQSGLIVPEHYQDKN